MSEGGADPEPENIRVRCVDCATDYVTSRAAFDGFKCKCPVCRSAKAQAQE